MTTPTPAAPQPRGRLLILDARITFSKGVHEASLPKGVTTGNPAFSYKLILGRDHPQLPAILKEINDAAVSLWKEAAPAMLAKAKADGKICLRDGNVTVDSEGKPYQGCAGNLVLSVRSDSVLYPKPAVMEGRLAVQTRAESRIFDGCRVNALVNFFAYKKGSIGVGCRQLATQFLRKDEPLGGGGAPADLSVFPEVDSSAEAASEFGALFGVPGPAGVASII